MRDNRYTNYRTVLDMIALALLIVGEICFYRKETINFYFIMTGFGIATGAIVCVTRYVKRVVNVKRFPGWLTLFWLIYLVYGLFRLQRGDFSLDTVAYRFVEILAMYFLVRDISRDEEEKIIMPFLFAGLFALGYLFVSEGNFLSTGTIRIGNYMSGNVNTVGYNFGIVSLFVMWWYCLEKKWYKLICFLVFAAFMLLTGSKKVLIILLVDFLLLFGYERGHASRWLKIVLGLVVVAYVILNVPIFYNMIGFRVESMISTMIYGRNGAIYSYSTDVREKMIQEGLQLFLKKPLLGGGYNNFYAHTIYGYDYSHNNYIELLCTFGLVGTLIFYSKHIENLMFLLKNGMRNKLRDSKYLFPLALMIAILAMDWAAVSFSALCVWYIPIIVSSVMVENMKYRTPSEV